MHLAPMKEGTNEIKFCFFEKDGAKSWGTFEVREDGRAGTTVENWERGNRDRKRNAITNAESDD